MSEDSPWGPVPERVTVTFTVVAGGGTPSGPPCRLHGLPCRTPWGWDAEHTDQHRPYTLAELEHRQDGPHRFAYPTAEEYEQGFYLWRAIRRDERLNPQEADVRQAGLERAIWARFDEMAAEMGDWR